MSEQGTGGGAARGTISKIVLQCGADLRAQGLACIDVWRDGKKAETCTFEQKPKRGSRTEYIFGTEQPPKIQAFSFLLWLLSRADHAEPVKAADIERLLGWTPFENERSLHGALDRLVDGSQVLKRENYVVSLRVPVDIEPKAELQAILRWAHVLPDEREPPRAAKPAADSTRVHVAAPPSPDQQPPPPPRERMPPPPDKEPLRRRLRVLLKGSSALCEVLARSFKVVVDGVAFSRPGAVGEAGHNPVIDALVCALLDQKRVARDLAQGLRWAVEAPETVEAVHEELREVAKIVLPQAADFQERLGEGKRQLGGRILVLPFASRLEAEIGLATAAGRAMHLESRPVRPSSSETELVSAAMHPTSDIRAASEVTMSATSRHLVEEIAYYFATRVRFGPRRAEGGRFLYTDLQHVDLNFRNEGALKRVLDRVNDALLFHSDAKDSDLLPMHVEVDVDGLFERLRDASDKLLGELGAAFPQLGFVRLTRDSDPQTYFLMCLLKIFLPTRKVPA